MFKLYGYYDHDSLFIAGRPHGATGIFLYKEATKEKGAFLNVRDRYYAKEWGIHGAVSAIKFTFGMETGNIYMCVGYQFEHEEMRNVLMKGDELNRI